AVISTPTHRNDLLATGNLQVPQRWWEIPVRLHVSSAAIRPEDAFVAFLHFLAFFPLGYAALGTLAHQRRRLFWPLFLVFVLAIGIEASKVLFELRHPTVLNFVANLAGGLVGAFAFWRFGRMRQNQ